MSSQTMTHCDLHPDTKTIGVIVVHMNAWDGGRLVHRGICTKCLAPELIENMKAMVEESS